MQIVIFLAVLSLVVMIHELGHLVAAKLFGVRVDEFGFGLPPRLFRVFRKGGTDYTINALPIGGFVKLYGESGEVELEVPKEKAFWHKKAWQRAVIVTAGVVMNFVLAVVLFATVYSFLGIPTRIEGAKVMEIAEGSPAQMVGLGTGEVVVSVVRQGETQSIGSVEEFLELVEKSKGEEMELLLLRDGETRRVRVTPRVDPPEGEGSLGVVISDLELKFYPWWQMPFRGVAAGVTEALTWGRDILFGLGDLVFRIITGKGIEKEALAGPVGIYQITGQVSRAGILPLLQFVGVLSVNLAILNIIPFPALDGGRLAFLGVEMITGKRVRDSIEAWVHSVGMMVLLGLMVLITANDFLRILGGWNGILGKLGLN